jgi:Ca2+-binding EF-hand superfamily protein
MTQNSYQLFKAFALALMITIASTGCNSSYSQSLKPGNEKSRTADRLDLREPAETEARFMRIYDLNRDGRVSPAEIARDQALLFSALDIDGDKTLSVDEMRRRGRTLQIFRSTTIFDMLDTNGDGKLSLQELQAPSQRWFKRYDKNGDGVMEISEVPNRPGRRYRPGPRSMR